MKRSDLREDVVRVDPPQDWPKPPGSDLIGPPLEYEPNWLDGLMSKVSVKTIFNPITKVINDQRRKYATRALEKDLTEILILMEGHQAQGRKAGDTCFQALYNQADTAITQFCVQWSADRDSLLQQYPNYYKLKSLTEPNPSDNPAVKAIGWTIAAVVIVMILGALWGVLMGIAHRVTQLFGG
jgi:hypothetical protein